MPTKTLVERVASEVQEAQGLPDEICPVKTAQGIIEMVKAEPPTLQEVQQAVENLREIQALDGSGAAPKGRLGVAIARATELSMRRGVDPDLWIAQAIEEKNELEAGTGRAELAMRDEWLMEEAEHE